MTNEDLARATSATPVEMNRNDGERTQGTGRFMQPEARGGVLQDAADANSLQFAAHKGDIDLIAMARATQASHDRRWGTGAVKLIAPAKVNLFLGIGARRADGYHEAVTVLHALALHDVLYLRRAVDGEGEAVGNELAGPKGTIAVRIECVPFEGLSSLDVPARKNIVFRAIDELARETGRTVAEAIEVRLEKHIPHQAGLGGGSSDAAAALLGVARLWGMEPDDPALERVACRLGSDVAFFLRGGCAFFDGAGERFCHALEPMKGSLVLVKPKAGVSTAAAYQAFDEAPGRLDAGAVQCATRAVRAADVRLCNNLAAASERLVPELANIRLWALAQPGVQAALLCGSGSATFALVGSIDEACRMVAAARSRGWWARTTTLGPFKAAIAP